MTATDRFVPRGGRVIETDRLTKKFGDKVALDGLTLSVGAG